MIMIVRPDLHVEQWLLSNFLQIQKSHWVIIIIEICKLKFRTDTLQQKTGKKVFLG